MLEPDGLGWYSVCGGLGLRSLIGLSPSLSVAGSVITGVGSVKYSMEEWWRVWVGHVIGITGIAWLKVVGSVGVRALGGIDGGAIGWDIFWGICVVGAGGMMGPEGAWGRE